MLRQALSSVGKRGLQGLRQFAAVPAVAPEVSDVLVPEPAPWTNSRGCAARRERHALRKLSSAGQNSFRKCKD